MRRALTDEALLSAAFSAESVLIEVIFIVGPLWSRSLPRRPPPHWPSGSPPPVRSSARSRGATLRTWLQSALLRHALRLPRNRHYGVRRRDKRRRACWRAARPDERGQRSWGPCLWKPRVARAACAPVRGGNRPDGRRARRARGALATLGVCGLVAFSRGRDCARLDYSIHARHEDCGDRALHRGFHMDVERLPWSAAFVAGAAAALLSAAGARVFLRR